MPSIPELTFLTRRFSSTRAVLLQLSGVSVELFDLFDPTQSTPAVDVELQGTEAVRLTMVGDANTAAFLKDVILTLAAHFGERVAVAATAVKVGTEERQLLDVLFEEERRSGSGTPPPPGAERRAGVLGGVTTFLS